MRIWKIYTIFSCFSFTYSCISINSQITCLNAEFSQRDACTCTLLPSLVLVSDFECFDKLRIWDSFCLIHVLFGNYKLNKPYNTCTLLQVLVLFCKCLYWFQTLSVLTNLEFGINFCLVGIHVQLGNIDYGVD